MEIETASKEQRNCTGKHKHRGKVETDGLTDGEILLFTSYKYQLTNEYYISIQKYRVAFVKGNGRNGRERQTHRRMDRKRQEMREGRESRGKKGRREGGDSRRKRGSEGGREGSEGGREGGATS